MLSDLFIQSELSFFAQRFLRIAYGFLLLVTLLWSLPQARRFYVTERYGGYSESGRWKDRLQNPRILPFILGFWGFCACTMIAGYQTVIFSLFNLLLCRYYFIQMRWHSLLRGMGAPGFMTYWLAALIFFLEYSQWADPTGTLRSTSVFLFRLDFALIILSAGLYKVFCGYPRNEGMEYGLVNPWWGYWWRWYGSFPPKHWIFRTLNHLAYLTEIVAAVLLLFPKTQVVGALIIIVSFAFIASQIRLGFLCEMVMVAAILYIGSGSLGDQWIRSLFPPVLEHGSMVVGDYPAVSQIVHGLLWAYIVILPLAHAGLYYNFFARRPLPTYFQNFLERYTNFFGIIIWRVFSVDIINFFARIYVGSSRSGERRLYSPLSEMDWNSGPRYLHVGESIALASIFTTLKYYPSDERMFRDRLFRYARTVPQDKGSYIVFECVRIVKEDKQFGYIPVVEYIVDPEHEDLSEKILDSRYSIRAQERVSPVHEGAFPGSYAPSGYS